MSESLSRPPWADSKACRAWLEQRYPLGDASLESPLYRYMQEAREHASKKMGAGLDFAAMGDMLSWGEVMRWQGEYHDLTISYSSTREKLYPGFGESTRPGPRELPRLEQRTTGADSTEPKWIDVKSSRLWLERSYPLGSSGLGSPLLQYMRACHAAKNSTSSSMTYLGSMLTNNEWQSFLSHCPDSDGHRQHGHPDNILYPEYGEEGADAMDIDSDSLRRQSPNSSNTTPLAQPPKKRNIEEVEDEQQARPLSKKRRALSDTGDDASIASYYPEETSPADASRKRNIADVEDEPPIISIPKRKRVSLDSGNGLPPSSPFEPQEQSTPSPLPRLDEIPTEDITTGVRPDTVSLGHESPSYEDPTTVIFKPNDTFRTNDMVRPDLRVDSQPQPIENERIAEEINTNTYNQSTAPPSSHGAIMNAWNETQERDNDGLTPMKSKSHDEHDIHVEEEGVNTTMDSENPRDQMTTNVIMGSGDTTEQAAISIVVPIRQSQHDATVEQQLLRDLNTMNVPIVRNKRDGGRKLNTKGAKFPPSNSQRKQGKRKPPNKGQKDRASKPEREQQTYVGRLRSGIGDRKHKKPSK